jgi:hypothetical protein
VIERTDRQFFAGTDVDAVVTALAQGLHAQGLGLTQTGPSSWKARGTVPSYGVVPEVRVTAMPSPQGFFLDVRFTIDLEGTGVVLAILAWFLCFPLAIGLAVLAYLDVSQKLRVLHGTFWTPVAHRIVAPNYPPALGGWGPPPNQG